MKTLTALGFLLAVGLALAVGIQAVDTWRAGELVRAQADAEAIRARAAVETAAQAARARVDLAGDLAAQPAAVAARTVAYLGVGLAVAVLAVGLALAGVRWLSLRSSLVYPTQGGQFPVIRESGRQWAALIDPNRSPGLALIDGAGRVTMPLQLSEGAALQLTAQASAVAMTAGATRHPGAPSNVAAAIDAAATRAAALSMPMPEVTRLDAAHVDRLLELTAPED